MNDLKSAEGSAAWWRTGAHFVKERVVVLLLLLLGPREEGVLKDHVVVVQLRQDLRCEAQAHSYRLRLA